MSLTVRMNLRDVVNQSRYAAGSGRGGQFGAWKQQIERAFKDEARRAQEAAAKTHLEKSRENISRATIAVGRLNTAERNHRAVVTPRTGKLVRAIESDQVVRFRVSRAHGVELGLWDVDTLDSLAKHWRHTEFGAEGQVRKRLFDHSTARKGSVAMRRRRPGIDNDARPIVNPIKEQRNLRDQVEKLRNGRSLEAAVERRMRYAFPGWTWR